MASPSFAAVPLIICVSSCPARPTNGKPDSSSSAPGPSPTKNQPGLWIARTENDLVALLAQAAAAAIADLVADFLQGVV